MRPRRARAGRPLRPHQSSAATAPPAGAGKHAAAGGSVSSRICAPDPCAPTHKARVVCVADALMIEVHLGPEIAPSDEIQSLKPSLLR